MKKIIISLLLLLLLTPLTTLQGSESENLQTIIDNNRKITLPKDKDWQEHIVIKEDKFIDFRHGTLTGKDKNQPTVLIKGNVQVELYHVSIVNGANKCTLPPGCLAQAIRVEGNARVILGNVTIKNHPFHGLKAYDDSKVTIFRSNFAKNGVGVAGFDNSRIKTFDTDIKESDDDGVWAVNNSKVMLRNSRVHDNLSDGLEIRNHGIIRLINTKVYNNRLKKYKIFGNGELKEE